MMKRRLGTTNNAMKMAGEQNMAMDSGMTNNNNNNNQSVAAALKDKKTPTVNDIPELMNIIRSYETATGDEALQAVRGIRRMLSVERNPPVKEVLAAGALPYFVKMLEKYDDWMLMFEAAWALTNIASTERTRDVVEGGAVGPLITLLGHDNPDLREQAVWCLGNIAGDCSDFRDYVVNQGIIGPM